VAFQREFQYRFSGLLVVFIIAVKGAEMRGKLRGDFNVHPYFLASTP
jgi:hypothetical protein